MAAITGKASEALPLGVVTDLCVALEDAYREGYSDGANDFCEGAKVSKYIDSGWDASNVKASLSRREK